MNTSKVGPPPDCAEQLQPIETGLGTRIHNRFAAIGGVDLSLPKRASIRYPSNIGPVRDEVHYQQMRELLDALLDVAGGNETHPAMGLTDIVGDLIEDYEREHHNLPEATGIQALRFFMEQHGLTQDDLPEIGSQTEVSEILSGQQELNIQQVRALAQRFGVATGTFI